MKRLLGRGGKMIFSWNFEKENAKEQLMEEEV